MSIPHNSELHPGATGRVFSSLIFVAMQYLPHVVRPIWDVARSIQACLLLVSLSGLKFLRQALFHYGFLPHSSKRPKHNVARFIQALTLPPLIYPFLPFAQELFRYGYLPHTSIMLSNCPNAPLPPLIQTSLSRTSYSHTFHTSKRPKCTFSRPSPTFLDPRLFLPILLAINPFTNATPILSSRIH